MVVVRVCGLRDVDDVGCMWCFAELGRARCVIAFFLLLVCILEQRKGGTHDGVCAPSLQPRCAGQAWPCAVSSEMWIQANDKL